MVNSRDFTIAGREFTESFPNSHRLHCDQGNLNDIRWNVKDGASGTSKYWAKINRLKVDLLVVFLEQVSYALPACVCPCGV